MFLLGYTCTGWALLDLIQSDSLATLAEWSTSGKYYYW